MSSKRISLQRLKGKTAHQAVSAVLSLSLHYYRLEPYFIRKRTNPQYSVIRSFIESTARKLAPGAVVLDAGAGGKPYQRFFEHVKYESTDFQDPWARHTYTCDLISIPRPNAHYDAILCTEVLEHIEEPDKMLREFRRVLKPGGKLYLTVPLLARLHGSPHHFNNYALHGLESIFSRTGFEVVSIRAQNGVFKYLGNLLRSLPTELLGQYTDKPLLFVFLALPLIILSPLLMYVLPIMLYYLDWLDREKNYTFGYSCICSKPAPSGND